VKNNLKVSQCFLIYEFPKMIFFDVLMFIMHNWRPLKIGGPRRLPSLPDGRTGPAFEKIILSSNLAIGLPLLRLLFPVSNNEDFPRPSFVIHNITT